MNFNKNITLRFIYQGKQIMYRALFCEYYYGCIPLYFSEDIDKLKIIQIANEEIFMVFNKEYRQKIGETQFEIEVLHNILRLKYKNISNNIIDICCANQLGYKNTIDKIKSLNTITNNEKVSRIKVLEDNFTKDIKLKQHSIDNILQNFKFINIS